MKDEKALRGFGYQVSTERSSLSIYSCNVKLWISGIKFLLSSLTALKLRRTSPREVFVQSNTSVFLPCPVHSFHATYRWEKDNCIKNYPCIFSGDFCVLGPVVDTPLKEGVFRCMATEDGFKVEVISFRLVNDGRLLAASLAFTLGPSLLLAMATLWLH